MRLAERLRPLDRPAVLLGVLVLVQWAVVGGIALSAQRNGWFFYQGGDETYYYTTSWLLGQGLLPQTQIGYGWSLLTLPTTLLGDASVLDALPAIVLGQYLLLLPIGLLAVWSIGASCGGRPLAISAAVFWATLPALSIPMFAERYHPIYVDTVLPQLLGLTNLGDFPSTIALLVAAALLLRGIDRRAHELVLLSALVTGFAIGIKPANLVFLAAPFLLLAVSRRPVGLAVYAVGLLPALATLAIWKQRGLGKLPLFAQPDTLLAGGAHLVVAVDRILYQRYIDVDWGHLWLNLRQLQEVFWGLRVLEWFVLAGLFAVGRRSIPKALFLAAWLGSYLVFKGGSSAAVVQQGSFFRLVQPGLAAAAILAAATVLLFPPVARWARATSEQQPPSPPRRRRIAVAATGVLLLGFAPLVVVSGVRTLDEERAAVYGRDSVFVPVNAFPLETTRAGSRVTLSWPAPRGSTSAFSRVLRSEPGEGTDLLVGVRNGLACTDTYLPKGCTVFSDIIGTTRGDIFVDRPPPGRWTYRIAVSANAYDSLDEGDVVLVSDGAVVTVP